jgi:hypothetical protein
MIIWRNDPRYPQWYVWVSMPFLAVAEIFILILFEAGYLKRRCP